ncbi:hypothetical protein HanLR1_Chr06g0201471 [Helianthus annuus]|nr:hypothetical protein HanLR1_Chr06g0201471 [Helianthus annuus]
MSFSIISSNPPLCFTMRCSSMRLRSRPSINSGGIAFSQTIPRKSVMNQTKISSNGASKNLGCFLISSCSVIRSPGSTQLSMIKSLSTTSSSS